jgi:glycosyltransferase involved in cell wall biosynthesis
VKRRLRILFVIGFLADAGGAERFALGLATHLPQDRFEPWVCAPRGGHDGPRRVLAEAGIPFVTLGRRAKWDVHRLAGLATLVRRERFDILHAHMFGSNVWGTIVGRACRVPVVIAHEQTWSYEGNAMRAWVDGHVIGRLATRFVAVSNADADRMVKLERVPAEKVVVLPNAHVPHPSSTGGDLRAELGLATGTPLIGAAALLRPQKALHVLLDAHARVVRAVPDAHLVIAGDGPLQPALQRQAADLGLAGSVHFLGRRNDVDSIIRDLGIAALSSDFEGTPLFAFECMANHTPLVATAVGGLLDIIDDGQTGLLVPRRDPEALGDALTRLLLDPGLRGRLATAAAGNLDRFTIDAIACRFADLYESLSPGR